MSLASCSIAFIKQVLCGNSVLRATFKTFLNSQILLADAEIALLASQIARLDILNSFANLEIQTLAAVQNKIQSDLNVVLGPMQGFAGCPTISGFMSQATNNATTKALAGFQNLIYAYNKRAYVANTLTAKVKQLQAFVNQAQEFLNAIDSICNP